MTPRHNAFRECVPVGRTKTWIKKAVKGGAALAGAVLPRSAPAARILTYHSVGVRDHEMNVSPDAFARQMEWLAANARVISLADAAAGRTGVAVTFDDGYRDNLTEAAPVLLRLRIPAAVFLVAGKMGRTLDHDAGRDGAAILTWDEARALYSMGIGLGSHGMTHRRLAALSEAAQREEVAGSKKTIEDRLGISIEAFAYPFGSAADYNDIGMRLVRESGYACAASNRYGLNRPGGDPWQLRRIWVDASDTLASFQAKVDGRLDLLSLIDSRAGIAARRLLNRILRA